MMALIILTVMVDPMTVFAKMIQLIRFTLVGSKVRQAPNHPPTVDQPKLPASASAVSPTICRLGDNLTRWFVVLFF